MEKLLTIIVPTFNMERLLPRCLNSLCGFEGLEVLVVNDGSSDNSSEIAHSYEQREGQTFRVIDKQNGNYGSTINAALPLATGRFVKILDADDRFDRGALAQCLRELEGCTSDLVVTHYRMIKAKGRSELAKYNLYGREPYEYGREYPLDSVLADGHIRFFLMHSIMWRTEMLRQNGYRQTEGISYTDLEWDTYPMFWARSVTFLNIELYQYYLDREGQTMDPKVLLRSAGQLEKVTESLLDFYSKSGEQAMSAERADWLRKYYLNRLRLVLKMHLLDMPRQQFCGEHFKQLDSHYAEACQKYGFGQIRIYPENKIIHLDALAHYHRTGRRWSAAFEAFNRAVDRIIKPLYICLFRH